MHDERIQITHIVIFIIIITTDQSNKTSTVYKAM